MSVENRTGLEEEQIAEERKRQETLTALNAVYDNGKETELGVKIVELGKKLGLDLRSSRMMLEAIENGCTETISTILGFRGGKDVFLTGREGENNAKKAHEKFVNQDSDFITVLNAWRAYQKLLKEADDFDDIKKNEKIDQWCQNNYIDRKKLEEAGEYRKELLDKLKGNEIKVSTNDEADVIGKTILPALRGNILFRGDDKNNEHVYYRGENKDHCFNIRTLKDTTVNPDSVLMQYGQISPNDFIGTNDSGMCQRLKKEWILEELLTTTNDLYLMRGNETRKVIEDEIFEIEKPEIIFDIEGDRPMSRHSYVFNHIIYMDEDVSNVRLDAFTYDVEMELEEATSAFAGVLTEEYIDDNLKEKIRINIPDMDSVLWHNNCAVKVEKSAAFKDIYSIYAEIFKREGVFSIRKLKEKIEDGSIKIIELEFFKDKEGKEKMRIKIENERKKKETEKLLEDIEKKQRLINNYNCEEYGLKWEEIKDMDEIVSLARKELDSKPGERDKELLKINSRLAGAIEYNKERKISLEKIDKAIEEHYSNCPVCNGEIEVNNVPSSRDEEGYTTYECSGTYNHRDMIEGGKEIEFLKKIEENGGEDLIISQLETENGEIIVQLVLTTRGHRLGKNKGGTNWFNDNEIRLLKGRDVYGKQWNGGTIKEIKLVDANFKKEEEKVQDVESVKNFEKNKEFKGEIEFLIWIANNTRLKSSSEINEFRDFTENLDDKKPPKIKQKINSFKKLVENSIVDIISKNEEAVFYIEEGEATSEVIREKVMEALTQKYKEENIEIDWKIIIENALGELIK